MEPINTKNIKINSMNSFNYPYFCLIEIYRGLIYGKKLDRQYNCCIYADHPQNVLLAGNKTVDLLDARVDGSPRLLFSTKNEKLGTFYNVSDEEVISCLAPSTKIHVSDQKHQNKKLAISLLDLPLQSFLSRFILQQRTKVF